MKTQTDPGTQPPSLERLLQEFHSDCTDRDMTLESNRRYESCLQTFLDFLKEQQVEILEVGNDEVILYIRRRRNQGGRGGQGVKKKTLENDFAAISAFYDFTVFKGYLRGNPVPPSGSGTS
ncbi:MAG: site-specific integrase [Nitrososphaerales archaeon]